MPWTLTTQRTHRRIRRLTHLRARGEISSLALSRQEKQAKLLLRRITSEIEKWVSDENDPLYGLNVMIERDDRGEFSTVHVRCRRRNVVKKKRITPTA